MVKVGSVLELSFHIVIDFIASLTIVSSPYLFTVIQWSRNGRTLNSSLSLNLQESSGPQVLLTVEPQVSLTEPITGQLPKARVYM